MAGMGGQRTLLLISHGQAVMPAGVADYEWVARFPLGTNVLLPIYFPKRFAVVP
jgi:hypothetical protein